MNAPAINANTHAHQAENHQSLELVVKLDHDLLLKRILAGGFASEFLAAAFLSCYRNRPFNHSLFNTIRLDAEAFRLFYGVLNMRYVKGWDGPALYELELQILKFIQNQQA
jgi:hypothetical protein